MTDETEIPDGKVDSKLLLSILRDIRREQREHMALTVAMSDRLLTLDKRLNQNMADLRDDLVLMLKSEVIGRLTHFETRIDQKIEELLGQV